jgi:hypothetical protein
MGSEILIIAIIFGTIFGIFYLFISSRNKERLALIEKGAEASIFVKGKSTLNIWKILVVNTALLLIGIGLGIFLGNLFHYSFGMEEGPAYTGTVFFMSGLSLISGYFLNKNINK